MVRIGNRVGCLEMEQNGSKEVNFFSLVLAPQLSRELGSLYRSIQAVLMICWKLTCGNNKQSNETQLLGSNITCEKHARKRGGLPMSSLTPLDQTVRSSCQFIVIVIGRLNPIHATNNIIRIHRLINIPSTQTETPFPFHLSLTSYRYNSIFQF